MKKYCILLIIALLSINEVSAQMPEVCKIALDKGKKEYEAGNYDEAIKKFKEGEDLSVCKEECNEWINKCEDRIKEQRSKQQQQQKEREEAERKMREQEAKKQQEAERIAREQQEEKQRQEKLKISTLPDVINRQMVYVQGGKFDMGCQKNCGEYERPVHQVVLNDFYIGKYEITQQIWQDIMGDSLSGFAGNNLPVESVTWNDVQDFIFQLNKLSGKNYRLPTEAEWEYAARGGNQSKKNTYSGSKDAGSIAWYYLNSNGSTHSIGIKKANELGLYDMSGNVSEWCNDLFGIYRSRIETNPIGNSTGSEHVIRGGHWDGDATELRVSSRASAGADYHDNIIGFRLAHDAENKRSIAKSEEQKQLVHIMRNRQPEQEQQDKHKQTDSIQKYSEFIYGINLGASFLNNKDDYEVSQGEQLDITIGGLFSRYFGIQTMLSVTAYSTGDKFNEGFGLGGLYIGPLLNFPLTKSVSANFEIYPAIGIARSLSTSTNKYVTSGRIGCGFRFNSGHAFYRIGGNYIIGELNDKDLSSFGVSLGVGLRF
jgi:formylglycine-generating enzyme required for sulfatase activity